MYLIYDLYVNTSLNVDLGANKPSKWREIAIISVRDFGILKFFLSLFLAHFSIFSAEIFRIHQKPYFDLMLLIHFSKKISRAKARRFYGSNTCVPYGVTQCHRCHFGGTRPNIISKVAPYVYLSPTTNISNSIIPKKSG